MRFLEKILDGTKHLSLISVGRVRKLKWTRLAAILISMPFLAIVAVSSPPAGAQAPPVHVVTFVENDGPSDSVTTFQDGSYSTNQPSTPLTLFADLNPSFSNPGFVFSDWNTSADGSGQSYADGASYSFQSDLILYAQWAATPVAHTVTFFENDSGSDSVSAYETETSSNPLTTFVSLDFQNVGHTFIGWNTEADGSGQSYSDGQIYAFSTDLSLYAQWTASSNVSVTFDDNGGTGSVGSLSVASGTTVTLPAGSALSYPSWTFVGWNTEASGLGTEYAPGTSLTLSTSITLYAHWVQDSFIVTFDPEGGSSTASTLTYSVGSPALVLPQATLAGSVFDGWFSAPTGGVLAGTGGAAYTPTQSLTLYAQWSATALVTVSFDANGGSGAIDPLTDSPGQPLSLPSGTSLIRPGFTFAGWGTSATGAAQYASSASVAPTQSLTLYAIWKRSATVSTLYGAVGDFPRFQTSLTRTLSNQVMALARAVKVRGATHVELFGYTAFTGLASLDRSVSARRADAVARALRADLRRLHVKGVTVRASGEGSIAHRTSGAYSRVEVYLS